VSKSNYGLNPINAYRLSEKAISTFSTDHGILQMQILQENVIKNKLMLTEFFEEVPIKIYRSHMQ
jgi:sugar phosphate permease